MSIPGFEAITYNIAQDHDIDLDSGTPLSNTQERDTRGRHVVLGDDRISIAVGTHRAEDGDDPEFFILVSNGEKPNRPVTWWMLHRCNYTIGEESIPQIWWFDGEEVRNPEDAKARVKDMFRKAVRDSRSPQLEERA